MDSRCSECGERSRLNAVGTCAYRGGCEHRQLRHNAEMARLLAEMDYRDEIAAARSAHPSTWQTDAMAFTDPIMDALRSLADEAEERFLRELREGYGE